MHRTLWTLITLLTITTAGPAQAATKTKPRIQELQKVIHEIGIEQRRGRQKERAAEALKNKFSKPEEIYYQARLEALAGKNLEARLTFERHVNASLKSWSRLPVEQQVALLDSIRRLQRPELLASVGPVKEEKVSRSQRAIFQQIEWWCETATLQALATKPVPAFPIDQEVRTGLTGATPTLTKAGQFAPPKERIVILAFFDVGSPAARAGLVMLHKLKANPKYASILVVPITTLRGSAIQFAANATPDALLTSTHRSTDSKPDQIRCLEQITKMLGFPVLVVPREVWWATFWIRVAPTYVVVDGAGVVAGSAVSSLDTMWGVVRKILAK